MKRIEDVLGSIVCFCEMGLSASSELPDDPFQATRLPEEQIAAARHALEQIREAVRAARAESEGAAAEAGET
jgi:hypothetical protein